MPRVIVKSLAREIGAAEEEACRGSDQGRLAEVEMMWVRLQAELWRGVGFGRHRRIAGPGLEQESLQTGHSRQAADDL
jgi:hypothetical protein